MVLMINIVYNVQTHFKEFMISYLFLQIIFIYLIITKKINDNKIKNIAKIFNSLSIIISILFLIEAMNLNSCNKYLKLLSYIMIIFSGFMRGLLEKLNNR
ncbi:hypothetical protein [Clostridium weizhouense]|uniref:Uncharacterized protein n=1 Tax=Clostridium weizhouense TaxID=2859781 RepID=A0ABS7AR22_9CLOT|nr:hypothetical protein [Clostridium weizhouense]MBW6411104.1 hypothetical protein [Clostridium weizhouense]